MKKVSQKVVVEKMSKQQLQEVKGGRRLRQDSNELEEVTVKPISRR